MDDVFLLTRVDGGRKRETLTFRSDSEAEPFELERGAVRRVVKGAVDLRRYFIEDHGRYVLFPYETGNGKAVLTGQREMRERFPLAWAYLQRHAKALQSRKKPGDWYSYRRRNYDLRDGVPRLLVPSIAKRASFVADLAGTYHFVGSGGGGGGGYGLTLKPSVAVSPLYLLGLLNSRLLDWVVKLSNSRFGQGYYSFNRQYIEPLPIYVPDLSDRSEKAEHDRIVSQVERLLSLYGRAPSNQDGKLWRQQIEAVDRAIDRLVYDLYGLTGDEIAIVESEAR